MKNRKITIQSDDDVEEVKSGAEKITEESSNVKNIPSFQLIDSSSSSDEKSPVIPRKKTVDLDSTLDNESSQKVELESTEVESKEVEGEEATNEEQIAEEKQNEDIPEGPQLGENKDVETNDDEDQIKENVDAQENEDIKENVETEDTIEDMKNEAKKLMDENENSNDGTPPRKKQKVEEEKIEDRQIDSSDEEPEEVNSE